MHLEKGFTLKESNYRDFMVHIRQVAKTLNWELFCEKRPSMDEELVLEFCMNLTSSEMKEVPAHGIKFFELPDFENDEYSTLMSNIKPENLQEILEELTVQGSTSTVSKQEIHTCRREYLTPLAKTIDVGKIILREIQNCAVKRSGPAHFPFTITILCLKAEILANVKKKGYSQGTITDWELHRVTETQFYSNELKEVRNLRTLMKKIPRCNHLKSLIR
ncbi:hypothetical protein PVK06_005646 [Gossypium arboreum]|uniref:Uncharacterized protein n=1 Tax=Gossypium arboreum TaxID=29729 RepID=A0ABR0QVB8_GOSAR|nr:hypothetical protein PVK06_005646 [Gossypium arboreum]